MKKYVYTVGSLAFAFVMSGLPAVVAHAEDGVSGVVRVNLNASTQTVGVSASTSASVRAGENEESSERRVTATSTSGRQGITLEQDLEIDDDTRPVASFSALKQEIETRRLKLDQEMTSTTSANQNIAKNTNPVRLAVHALLASKTLLGGIGPQVSLIAKNMNDSIATTTSAEARIQSRGFFAHFFFGGDSAAADVISQTVAQNQQRIDDLNKLLGEANVSADIQVVLKAQIAAIQDAQTRLQDLAQKEQKMWGFFSWRF